MKVIGLMSGTSLDGIDAVMVELTEDDGDRPHWRLEGFQTTPFPAGRRDDEPPGAIRASPGDAARRRLRALAGTVDHPGSGRKGMAPHRPGGRLDPPVGVERPDGRSDDPGGGPGG